MHTHLLGGFCPRKGGKGQWPLQLTGSGFCVRAEGKVTEAVGCIRAALETQRYYANIVAHLKLFKIQIVLTRTLIE